MGAPAVSVLLPVRDAEDTIAEAIGSLQAQTFGGWEAVVVDDGSADRTPERLAALAEADPRIRVVRQERAGIVPALERARREARAPYLARMDADDRAHASRLERQLEAMEANPAWVLCGTQVRYFPRSVLREGARRYEAWLNAMEGPADLDRDLFIECPLAHPTFFMRAEALQEVGGYRDPGWPEDYDLLLRLRGLGEIGIVPAVLLDWRESMDRLSRRHRRYEPEAFRRCKVAHLPDRRMRGRDGVVIWGAGPIGKAFSKTLRASGLKLRGWVEVDPRKIGQTIHGAPVFDVEKGAGMEGVLHLGAVGRPGARSRLREVVREAGLVEGRDFVAVA